MKVPRARTRRLRLGGLTLGHGAPVRVQSMTCTPTADVTATLGQIKRLAAAGCELVRVAVPDRDAAAALPRLVAASPLPLVADIHFDADLALAAVRARVAKVRINPGNLGMERALEVAAASAAAKVAVRIGVNSGSVPEAKRRRAKTDAALGRLMADLALEYARAFERQGQKAIVLSVKASSVPATLAGYRALAARCDYPLHLGLTEAGSEIPGAVKTAAALSPLLLEGIGDTLRVSLTGDPVAEIRVADLLLSATGVRRRGVDIIACPTCGRTVSDLPSILAQVEKALAAERSPLTVAVMGCVVNGPGEARHADVGIAGSPDGRFLLFAKGKPLGKVNAEEAVPALLEQVRRLAKKPGTKPRP